MGVLLVDENEKEYKTKYLARKSGLSGGWRRFSIDHKLQVKDVLVFHLIQECKFKVTLHNFNATVNFSISPIASFVMLCYVKPNGLPYNPGNTFCVASNYGIILPWY